MTNEELAILLPQINNLINAYEQGARKQLVRSDIKTVEAYALSLHMSPIQSMRFAMNTMDAVSLTPEEMESEYRAQTQSASNIETRSATKEIVKNDFFGIDCEIVGGDEFFDTEKIVGEDIKLGSQKIPSKLGYKLTNPVRVKVNLRPLQKMQETIEENSGKTLAECFDCNVAYTVDVMYPSIEVLWEFEKLLKGLLDAIKIIETNLSSAQMYSDVCKMKAFVGTNFLCPSMMTKINLMLPTLFMKYTLDLAKISIDLNFVLGGIFKVAISMIATFLENIRALIIPFIDCTIGAAKAVGGYIRSVAASISQGVDATTDIVNKAAQVVHKTALLVGEVFSEDPAGVFDRTKPIYKSLEDLNEQHLEAQDELAQLIARFNGDVVPKEVVDAEQSLSKSQFLLNALPVEYGGYYSGHPEKKTQ